MPAELCLPSSELDHLHFYIRRTNRQWKISWPQETKATIALPPTLFHCENNSSSWAPAKDVTPMKNTLSHAHTCALGCIHSEEAQESTALGSTLTTKKYSGKNNLHLSSADGGKCVAGGMSRCKYSCSKSFITYLKVRELTVGAVSGTERRLLNSTSKHLDCKITNEMGWMGMVL